MHYTATANNGKPLINTRIFTFLALIFFCFFIFTISALAAVDTYAVTPDTGILLSDSLSVYSPSDSFTTLSAAVNACVGDTHYKIYVDTGTYVNDSMTITVDNLTIIGIGYPDTFPIINVNNSNQDVYGIRAVNHSGLRIENLKIENSYYGIFFNGVTASVIENAVTENNYRGIYFFGAQNNSVINSIAKGNTQHGISLWASSNQNSFLNNTVENNDTGIYSKNSTNNYFAQNTLRNNNFSAVSIDEGVSGDIYGKNNIYDTIVNVTANTFDFTRNWWNTTDSDVIKDTRLSGTGLTYLPFRFNFIDTGVGADTVAPKTPDNIEVEELTPEQIRLTWNKPTLDEDNTALSGIAGYKIYRSEITNTADWHPAKAVIFDPNTTTYTDDGLDTGKAYYYRITAFDDNADTNESFYSAIQTVEPRLDPLVKITFPSDNHDTSVQTITVSGTTANISGETGDTVQLFVNGVSQGGHAIISQNGSWSLNASLTGYGDSVWIKLTDKFGRTHSDTVTVNYYALPSAAINTPADNHDTKEQLITVSGIVTNTRAGDTVILLVNGAAQGDSYTIGDTLGFSCTATLTGKGDSILVILTDAFGRAAYDTVTVNWFDTITAEINPALNNHDTSVQNVRVSGTTDTTSIGDTVELFINSVSQGDTAITSQNGSWLLNAFLTGYGDSVWIKLTDKFGRAVYDTITVNYFPSPLASITFPADNHDTNISIITISGTTLNTRTGDTIEIYNTNNILDTAVVISALDGTWSGTVSLTGYGDSVWIKITDGFERVNYDTITVNHFAAPSAKINLPADNHETTVQTITVSGTTAQTRAGDTVIIHVKNQAGNNVSMDTFTLTALNGEWSGTVTFEHGNSEYIGDSVWIKLITRFDSAAYDTISAAYNYDSTSWYVNSSTAGGDFTLDSGSAAGDGSPLFPFLTIDTALTRKVQTGHTLYIDSGIYNEEVVIQIDNITLIGTDTTVIEGGAGGYGIHVSGKSGVKLQNLKVQNSDYGIFLQSSELCEIRNVKASGNSRGIYLWGSSNNLIISSVSENNNGYGFSFAGGSGSNTVINNLSQDNTGTNGYGFHIKDSLNNKFYQNTSSGHNRADFLIEGSASGNTVNKNNLTTNGLRGAVENDASHSLNFEKNWWGKTDTDYLNTLMTGAESSKINYGYFRFNEIDTSPHADTVSPQTPDNITVDLSVIRQITLSWNKPSLNEDGSSLTDLAGYKIYKSMNMDTSDWQPAYAVKTDTNNPNFTDTDILPGETYYYRITAFDNHADTNESFYSQIITVVPIPPEIEITRPSTGHDTREQVIIISGVTSGTNAGDTVYFYVNSTPQNDPDSFQLSAQDGNWSGTVTLTGAGDKVWVKMIDSVNPLIIVYDTITVNWFDAPSAALTFPENGHETTATKITVSGTTANISGTVNDKVELFVNASTQGETVITGLNGSWIYYEVPLTELTELGDSVWIKITDQFGRVNYDTVTIRNIYNGPDWYVDTATGVDTNPGTETSPFKTIQRAVDMANTGDTIYIDTGVYSETVVIEKSNLALISRAPDSAQVSIKNPLSDSSAANVYGIKISSGNNVKIRNLTVDGFYIGIFATSTVNSEFKDLILRNNGGSNASGIYLINASNNNAVENVWAKNNYRGIYLHESNYNTVQNCVVENSADRGMFLWVSKYNTVSGNILQNNGVSGVYLKRAEYNTFTDNISTDNNQIGFHIDDSSNRNTLRNNYAVNNTHGIYISLISNYNSVINNTAQNNISAGIFVSASSNNTVTNNLSDSNSRGIRVASPGNNYYSQNDLRNNTTQIYIDGEAGNDIFQKNNIYPSAIISQTVVNHNNSPSNMNFLRNYWFTTNTDTIASFISGTYKDKVNYSPYRMNEIDTDVGAETIATATTEIFTWDEDKGEIKLTWNSVTKDEEYGEIKTPDKYRIYKADVDDTPDWQPHVIVEVTGAADNDYIDTDVESGKTYYYRLTALVEHTNDTKNKTFVNQSFYSDVGIATAAMPQITLNQLAGANVISLGDTVYKTSDNYIKVEGGVEFTDPLSDTVELFVNGVSTGDTIAATQDWDSGIYLSSGKNTIRAVLTSPKKDKAGITGYSAWKEMNVYYYDTPSVFITSHADGDSAASNETISGTAAVASIGDSVYVYTLSGNDTEAGYKPQGEAGVIDADSGFTVHNVEITPAESGDSVIVKLVDAFGRTVWSDSINIFYFYVAPEWYVSGDTGNDGQPGTPEEPLKTIQAAVQKAEAGGNPADTIFVYGSDTPYASAQITKDNITLTGVDIGAKKVMIETGDSASVGSTALYASGRTNIKIQNVIVQNSYYGVWLHNTISSRIENIKSTHNHTGIYLWGADSNRIINNKIVSNKGHGVLLREESASNRMTNNLIQNNLMDALRFENSSNNYAAQNDLKDISAYAVYLAGISEGNSFSKNNIDTAVYNGTSKEFSFIRNWWGSADTGIISAMLKGGGASKIIWSPYRLTEVDTTPGADTVAPKAPSNITADTSVLGQITLTWTNVNQDEENAPSFNIYGYRVYRSMDADTSNWQPEIYETTGNIFTDTDIENDVAYYYRVTAFDSVTSGMTFQNESFYSSVISIRPLWPEVKFSLPDDNHDTTVQTITVSGKAVNALTADSVFLYLNGAVQGAAVSLPADLTWSKSITLSGWGDKITAKLITATADTKTAYDTITVNYSGATDAEGNTLTADTVIVSSEDTITVNITDETTALIVNVGDSDVVFNDSSSLTAQGELSYTISFKTDAKKHLVYEKPNTANFSHDTYSVIEPSGFDTFINHIRSVKVYDENWGEAAGSNSALYDTIIITLKVTDKFLRDNAIEITDLKLFVWDENENTWQTVTDVHYIYPDANTVKAYIPHFTVYGFFPSASPPSSLSGVRIYPNPFRPNDGDASTGTDFINEGDHTGIYFNGLMEGTKVEIYDALGRKVYEFTTSQGKNTAQWDVTNSRGQKLVSGVYVAVFSKGGNKEVRKIFIVR